MNVSRRLPGVLLAIVAIALTAVIFGRVSAGADPAPQDTTPIILKSPEPTPTPEPTPSATPSVTPSPDDDQVKPRLRDDDDDDGPDDDDDDDDDRDDLDDD